jgi:signal transduction histidine kinase
MLKHWRSIDSRLPLLIAGLLLATVAAFWWTAYRSVEQMLLQTAGDRLRSASLPIELSLAQSAIQMRARLQRLGGDPAIRGILTGGDSLAARRAVLPEFATPDSSRIRFEMRDREGRTVLVVAGSRSPAMSDWVERQIASRSADTGSLSVGPLVAENNSVFYETITPVTIRRARAGSDAGSETVVLGYIAQARAAAGTGMQMIRALIGKDLVMLVGMPGHGVWTDLEGPAAAPPSNLRPGSAVVFDSESWGEGIGAATAIRQTPWVVWVHQPRTTVLAPLRGLLKDLALLALFFVAVGALSGWLLSRRITRPIVRLTRAAESMTVGESGLAGPNGHDELERLTEAFSRMSASVNESRQQLERRVSERTLRLEEAMGKLESAQAQLLQKERLAMLGQLASAVGHELRNPLGVMTNAVYVLDHHLSDSPPTVREYLDLLRGQIAISERIVGDLLDTARQRPPQVEAIGVAELVDAQLHRIGPLAGIEVVRDFPDELPYASADPNQIAQILLNLLMNAAQSMSERGGGRLTIRARAPGGDRLWLEVADTGPGIPPDRLDKIFEPLFTTKARGLGLGLWVSRTLARANNAVLRVESTPGQGATFTLELPVAAPVLSASA